MTTHFDESKVRRDHGRFAIKGFSEAADGTEADLDMSFLDDAATVGDFGADPAARTIVEETPEPAQDEAHYRLVRLARVGKLPRSVKSAETTATRLDDALASPRVGIETYDDDPLVKVSIYDHLCRCGKPAVRAGACSNPLHGATAKPIVEERFYLGSYDTGHDLPAKLAPAIDRLIEQSPNEATTEDLQTLSDIAAVMNDPKTKQREIDAVNKAAQREAAAIRKAAAPPAPRRMNGWRERITAAAADTGAEAAEHGVRVEARPDNPEEVYVGVPVPATFRGEPQYDLDGNPRMRQTGFLTVQVDPTDRAQMSDLDAHIRASVADQLDGLRRSNHRYTAQANADNAAAAAVYEAWLNARG